MFKTSTFTTKLDKYYQAGNSLITKHHTVETQATNTKVDAYIKKLASREMIDIYAERVAIQKEKDIYTPMKQNLRMYHPWNRKYVPRIILVKHFLRVVSYGQSGKKQYRRSLLCITAGFFCTQISIFLLQRNYFAIDMHNPISHHPLDHLVEFFMREKCLELDACGCFVREKVSQYLSSNLSRRSLKFGLFGKRFDSSLLCCSD